MRIGFELTMRMRPLSSRYSQVTVPLVIEVKLKAACRAAAKPAPSYAPGDMLRATFQDTLTVGSVTSVDQADAAEPEKDCAKLPLTASVFVVS